MEPGRRSDMGFFVLTWCYIFNINGETGEVFDYVVKSKICFECKARSNWEKTSER